MNSPGAGGCDFASATETASPDAVLWAPHTLPSVIALTGLPTELASSDLRPPQLPLDASIETDGAEYLIEHRGTRFRVHIDDILLPLDQFFEIRMMAAIRLWRGLAGRSPGPNPADLSKARRDRLILALRALDARLDDATYREIASVLFGAGDLPERGWKSHDLRDRTIRLARFGFALMRGGYRRLLLHPYRRRL
jgi:hypothetical protein